MLSIMNMAVVELTGDILPKPHAGGPKPNWLLALLTRGCCSSVNDPRRQNGNDAISRRMQITNDDILSTVSFAW